MMRRNPRETKKANMTTTMSVGKNQNNAPVQLKFAALVSLALLEAAVEAVAAVVSIALDV
jgi:hypothetical protein